MRNLPYCETETFEVKFDPCGADVGLGEVDTVMPIQVGKQRAGRWEGPGEAGVDTIDCRKNMDELPVMAPTDCPWAGEKRFEATEVRVMGAAIL